MSFPASCPVCGSAIQFTSELDGVAHCPRCPFRLRLGDDDEGRPDHLKLDSVLAAAQMANQLQKLKTEAPARDAVVEQVGTGRVTACLALIGATVVFLLMLPWWDSSDRDDDWLDIPPPAFDGKLPDPKVQDADKPNHERGKR